MAILERDYRGRTTAPPALTVVEGLVAGDDLSPEEKKHMACLPGLATNRALMHGLAQEFSRARPDYVAQAADVYNAGKVGSGNRLKKEMDLIKSEADTRQQPGTITGYSWGSLDALYIASKMPQEVDEVVLLFSPHRLRKILTGNTMVPGQAYIINASGIADPVALFGGNYGYAHENVYTLNTHFGAVNPLEVKHVVNEVAPRLRGRAKPKLSIAS